MCNAIWFDVYCGELLDLGKVKLQFGKGHFRYCTGCVFFFWRVLVVGRFSKPEMFSLIIIRDAVAHSLTSAEKRVRARCRGPEPRNLLREIAVL